MSNKEQQIKKATKAAKSSKKGAIRRKYHVRSKLRFFKPATLKVASAPKYARSTSTLRMPAKFDKYSVLVNPLNTEKANKVMTERNTLVFLVHNRANKIQIKKAFQDIYQLKPKAINTLVRPDGKKKAYIRLRPEDDAVGVASKMGII
eukprot:TRINITY_DN32201_c0_g1_i1.p1 TRINITY_DN32201_c0_g1~~TRINITY_DN32201_c0_g1_i1.p1  ORF type:complete len:148 (-),score=12.33 TRINITY_DN32201_c0_g1_i1:12-455(-)